MKLSRKLILIFFYFLYLDIYSQYKIEKIDFISANPYTFNDIITNIDNQEKQKVYGKLIIPKDSIDYGKKYPLVIGVGTVIINTSAFLSSSSSRVNSMFFKSFNSFFENWFV